jgi:hypothetical protein
MLVPLAVQRYRRVTNTTQEAKYMSEPKTGAQRQAAFRKRQQEREKGLADALTVIASSRIGLKRAKEIAAEAVRVWEYRCASKT